MIKLGFPKKWVGNSPMFFLISKTPGWRWELGKKRGHAHPDASGGAISILAPLRRKLPRIDNTIHQVAENVWPIVHNQNLTSLEKFEEQNPKNPPKKRREFFFVKWDWRRWNFVHIRLIDLVDVWVLYYIFIFLWCFTWSPLILMEERAAKEEKKVCPHYTASPRKGHPKRSTFWRQR